MKFTHFTADQQKQEIESRIAQAEREYHALDIEREILELSLESDSEKESNEAKNRLPTVLARLSTFEKKMDVLRNRL